MSSPSSRRRVVQSVLAQALRPGRLRVMLQKLRTRLDVKGSLSEADNRRWLRAHAVDLEGFARQLDSALWDEAEQVTRELNEYGKQQLAQVPFRLGGRAASPLLYFLTRLARPRSVVETGVAAGFSSAAFLAALEANGHGRLYSSDFPYLRIPDPERFIGIAVPQRLRQRWELWIEGDTANLPEIVRRAHVIDLLHYDSDKTYSGRRRSLEFLRAYLAASALIVMDDIQDNSFFHDFVKERGTMRWHVFEFDGKYVGMIGLATPTT